MQKLYNWRRGYALTSLTAAKEYYQYNDIETQDDRALAVKELMDNDCAFLWDKLIEDDEGNIIVSKIKPETSISLWLTLIIAKETQGDFW